MSVNLKTTTEEITGEEIDAAVSDKALADLDPGPAQDLILKLAPVRYGEKVSAVVTRSWPV